MLTNASEMQSFGQNASTSHYGTTNANEVMSYNWAAMQAQQDFNAEQAKLNREWQEKMSNTSYQRAVKDMVAAGINPILAAQNGGASTPSGSSASAGMASGQAETKGEAESWGMSTASSVANWGLQLEGLGSAVTKVIGGLESIGMLPSGSSVKSLVDGLATTARKVINGIKDPLSTDRTAGRGVGRSDILKGMEEK